MPLQPVFGLPVQSAVVSLSAFRLLGVGDAPATIPVGSYGDEFEYATQAAFDAIWTPRGPNTPTVVVNGSSISYLCLPGPGGITQEVTLPTNCEFGVLISGARTTDGQPALGLIDNAGTGPAVAPYGGTTYDWALSAYGLGSYSGSAASFTQMNDGRPWWVLMKKVGTTYTARMSLDLVSFTAVGTGQTDARTITRIWIGQHYTAGQSPLLFHRLIYGSPNLGI